MDKTSNSDAQNIELKEGGVYLVRDKRFSERIIKIKILYLIDRTISYENVDEYGMYLTGFDYFNNNFDILEEVTVPKSVQHVYYMAYDPIKPNEGGVSLVEVILKDYLEAGAWERLVQASEKDTLADEKKYTLDEVEIIANAYSLVPVTKEDILWYFEHGEDA